ncbi:hypothetical protein HDV00_001542 [Rhizophlyctis rosea]|nr:hypothetical protein HDV00_001542 [Rhizophlyctis rosea]
MQPFPLNPFFKRTKPLSTETRKEIYQRFIENPAEWTPRRLAETFGISIIRVEAVIRLRAQAAKFEAEGRPLETEVSKGMDEMLGALTLKPPKDGQKLNPREKLRIVRADALRPFFQMVDEEDAFTPEDAARLMEREPYENVRLRLDRLAERAFQLEAPEQPKNPPAVRQDNHHKSEHQFLIADVGVMARSRWKAAAGHKTRKSSA